MTTGEAARVRQWLQRRWHVVAPEDWLEACLEWIHQENQGVSLGINDLNNMVYEQWLLSDLREIGSFCLPPGVALEQRIELDGHFCLQVDSIVDVSTPYYGQLQKVTGTENANVHVTATQATQPSWETKSGRMLMMKMTDGSQDIQGMEYRPIPCLNTGLIPGAKVLVSGSILCRLGVMMLTRENLTVLGGEVEGLLETNTQQKLLQDALSQNSDLGQNPPKEEKTQFERQNKTNTVNNRQIGHQGVAQPRQPVAPNRPGLQPSSNYPAKSQGKLEFPDDEDDGDFLDQLDTAALDAMEQWDDDVDYDAIMEEMDMTNATPSTTGNTPSYAGQQQPTARPTEAPPPSKRPCTSTQWQNTVHRNTMPQTSSSKAVIHPKGGNTDGSRPESMNRPKSAFNVPIKVSSSQQQRLDSFLNRNVKSNVGNQGGCNVNSIQNPKSSDRSIQKVDRKVKMEPKDQGNWFSGHNTFSEKYGTSTEQFVPENVKQPVTHFKTEATYMKEEDMFDDLDCIDLTEAMDDEKSQSILGHGNFNHPQPKNLGLESHTLSITELVDRYLKGTLVRKNRQERGTSNLCLDALPYTYLTQVEKCWPTAALQTCRVKAYISTLLSRLEHNEGKEWSLKVKINDGSVAMDVDLGDQMLSSLIGFTAPECMKMKVLAKSDKSLRLKIAEGIKHCQQSLIGLSSILELELAPSRPLPYVRQLFNLRPEDLGSIKDRVINA